MYVLFTFRAIQEECEKCKQELEELKGQTANIQVLYLVESF